MIDERDEREEKGRERGRESSKLAKGGLKAMLLRFISVVSPSISLLVSLQVR